MANLPPSHYVAAALERHVTPDDHRCRCGYEYPPGDGYWNWSPHVAVAALDAIPDGWAKVDGEWIDLNSSRGRAVLRCWAVESRGY